MKGWMYILKCADGSYYTGSTNNLKLRFAQHQAGEGANYTRKRLPVKLLYVEEYDRIDEAFYREKQVQGWSRKKKEALMQGMPERLHELARCLNGMELLMLASAPLSQQTALSQHTPTGSKQRTNNCVQPEQM